MAGAKLYVVRRIHRSGAHSEGESNEKELQVRTKSCRDELGVSRTEVPRLANGTSTRAAKWVVLGSEDI